MKLVICKGLPASGKTTFARKLVRDDPSYGRVNRDDLRGLIDDHQFSKGRENVIRTAELAIASALLDVGRSVVCDDTNLSPSAVKMWEDFAKQRHVQIEWSDFTNVPLEECIRRDRERPNYVGEKVIRRMWRQYLQPKPVSPVYDPTLPRAIICDLDGTLCLLNGRDPYNASTCDQDLPNQPVLDVAHRFVRDHTLVLVSGRSEEHRPQTELWLGKYLGTKRYVLYMREIGDMRKDAIIKREIYDAHIAGKYAVSLVLDDRDQVIRLWRDELGLPCFQVNYGDF